MSIDEQAEREGAALSRSFKSARPRAGGGGHAPLIKCGVKDAKRSREKQLKQAFKTRTAGINDNVSPAMMAYLNATNSETFTFR